MDFISIGQQFVQHYYNVFDTSRPVSFFTIMSFLLTFLHLESERVIY
jgi:hypothetical protein